MTTPVARERTSTGHSPVGHSSVGHSGRAIGRPLSRLLVLVLLTLAAGVGLAGPASAHNVLISSDPTDGSTLQTAPTTVRLTFDQPVQNFEPVIRIIGPDGQQYESGSPTVDSTVVTADVNPLPVAGEYSIAYRIVSADGHPVQGQLKFELPQSAVSGGSADSTGSSALDSAAPGSAASAASDPVVVSTSAAAVASTSSSSGLSGWVWAAIAVAAVLVAAAIFVIVRKPEQSR